MHDLKAKNLQVDKIRSRDSVTIAIQNLFRYAVSLVPANDYDLVPKWYVDTLTPKTVANATVSELTITALNAAYPTAVLGFEVWCENITDNPLMYKKGVSTWKSIPLGGVAI